MTLIVGDGEKPSRKHPAEALSAGLAVSGYFATKQNNELNSIL